MLPLDLEQADPPIPSTRDLLSIQHLHYHFTLLGAITIAVQSFHEFGGVCPFLAEIHICQGI